MARVVVLGSSNTDLTVRLPRLPAAGETLLGGAFVAGPGGKGANQAVAARRAGAEVVFLAAVGDDEYGRRALEGYRREGIAIEHVRIVPEAASGVALIFVGDDGENMIGVAPGANARLAPEDVDRLPDAIFERGAVFLAGLEVPLETVAHAIRRASAAGMTVVLNPAPADRQLLDIDILGNLDVLTPNRVEAFALTAERADGPDGAVRAAEALRRLGASSVIVTLGVEGHVLATEGGTHRGRAFPVTAVDTVGAGDAFNGALAAALAEGRPLGEAARWASAAAALAITRPGAQAALPTRTEIDRLAGP